MPDFKLLRKGNDTTIMANPAVDFVYRAKRYNNITLITLMNCTVASPSVVLHGVGGRNSSDAEFILDNPHGAYAELKECLRGTPIPFESTLID